MWLMSERLFWALRVVREKVQSLHFAWEIPEK